MRLAQPLSNDKWRVLDPAGVLERRNQIRRRVSRARVHRAQQIIHPLRLMRRVILGIFPTRHTSSGSFTSALVARNTLTWNLADPELPGPSEANVAAILRLAPLVG